MLVPSMNLQEISIEANAEYDVLVKYSTFQRLIREYLLQRYKKKVKNNEQ
jgi:hypothetical protein